LFHGTVLTPSGRSKPVFTEEQEQELAKHLRDFDSRFYDRGRKQFMYEYLAYKYAEKNNIPHRLIA
jgi:hypothetical protein